MHHETPVRRWLRRATAGTTTAGLLTLAVPAVTAPDVDGSAPSDAADPAVATAPSTAAALPGVQLVSHRKPHPNRKIKRYRVRPGDTPSEIAVRFHAWTAQLIRINHTSTLYAGQVIRVPVVVSAARACKRHEHHRTNVGKQRHRKADRASRGDGRNKASKPDRAKRPSKPKTHKKHTHKPRRPHAVRHAHGWHHRDASRADVRRVIIGKANRYGVNPDLALAISWQESGWQHDRVSSAGAIGAMQIMPGTGQWMSMVVGRRLNIRDLRDNAVAGVALVETLRDQARLKRSIAGYYQGLAGVRRHGMYDDTKRYVANVLALKKRIANGWNPS